MEINKSIQHILDAYFSGAELLKVNQNHTGLINQTYIVKVSLVEEVKTFILQQLNTNVFKKYKGMISNIIQVGGYLREHDYPYEFPMPIVNSDNSYYYKNASIWRLSPYIENTSCFDTVPSAEHAYEAAHCLGVFYRCLDGFDVGHLSVTLANFHHGAYRLEQFDEALMNGNTERIEEAKSLISDLLSHRNILEQFDVLQESLPQRVVHYDTKINNFLFDKNSTKVRALIDLDTLMPGTLLSDLGDMIRTYSNDLGEESEQVDMVKANFATIESLVKGFVEGAGSVLSKEEIQSIPLAGMALTYMQSIRFLTDYLNGDSYYKTSYPKHNLVRTRNQLALFYSLYLQL